MNHPKVDTELLGQILAQQIKTNELLRALITQAQAGQLSKELFKPLPPSTARPQQWETTCGTAMAT